MAWQLEESSMRIDSTTSSDVSCSRLWSTGKGAEELTPSRIRMMSVTTMRTARSSSSCALPLCVRPPPYCGKTKKYRIALLNTYATQFSIRVFNFSCRTRSRRVTGSSHWHGVLALWRQWAVCKITRHALFLFFCAFFNNFGSI